MYNLNYNYVEVFIGKDDMTDQLIEDLKTYTSHLFPVELETRWVYKGLVPRKELDSLFLLQAVSPYGAGYEIYIDKLEQKDFGTWTWKVARGIA